ncbi:MAG TPA: hypothetical protein VFP74_17775 [Pseudolabrys sp.]|jgi:hypothetical protein|nr:hypothetical protein [Pseudolabrys sp.]
MTIAVDDKVESLVFDLVEWVGKEPRTYRQTMDAWRTSCPRLPVWEEAVERGLVVREPGAEGGRVITTSRGFEFLALRGRAQRHS